MNRQRYKRLLAWLGAVCMLFSFAATAFAATTISDSDNPYDYFEYQNSSGWHDLNTPYHMDNSTGNWAYCIEHEKDPPSSSTQYTEVDPATVFSGNTIKGIQAILDHGYPSSSGGLSTAEAHYATANAIRALSMDAIEKAKSGHPGAPMGMADMAGVGQFIGRGGRGYSVLFTQWRAGLPGFGSRCFWT